MECILSVSEAATAAQIQTAIDEVAQSGGGRFAHTQYALRH